jgi:LPS O-antigen subunit length determinant protein (WzzB/FepE family)
MDKSFSEILILFKQIKSHVFNFLIIICVTMFLFIVGARFLIPTTYKSSFIVSIPTRYFQQISFDDIIPSAQDAGELKMMRESLIQNAIDDQFIEKLRDKYSFFPKQSKNSKEDKIAIQKIKSKIEIYSLDLTTFQISYSGDNSQMTYDIAMDLMSQVRSHILKSRSEKLLNLRGYFLSRVDALGFSVNQVSDPMSMARPEAIRNELSEIQSTLQTLSLRYTSKHPLILKYKDRENLLINRLKSNPEANPVELAKIKQGLSMPRQADTDRYADLIKRVENLNVLLDYEETDSDNLVIFRQKPILPISPLNPKMKLVVFWGMLISFILCAIYMVFRFNLKENLSESFKSEFSQEKSKNRIEMDFIEDQASLSIHQEKNKKELDSV